MYADHKTVECPDYPGNNMFNSFGNLALDPTAALLFIDFRSGRTLQLSGSAHVTWTPRPPTAPWPTSVTCSHSCTHPSWPRHAPGWKGAVF